MALPVAAPVTTPAISTGAIEELLLLHVPLAVASFNAVIDPRHTPREPVIGAGNGFTVTDAVAIQPVGKV